MNRLRLTIGGLLLWLLLTIHPATAQPDPSWLSHARQPITPDNAPHLLLLAQLEVYPPPIAGTWTTAAFSPDSRLLAASTRYGPHERHLKWWDATTGDLLGAGTYETAHWVTWQRFTPDNRAVITPDMPGGDFSSPDVRLWDVTTGRSFIWRVALPGAYDDCVWYGLHAVGGIYFDAGATLMAFSRCYLGDDESLVYWVARTGSVTATYPLDRSQFVSVRADGMPLVTNGGRTRLSVIDPLVSDTPMSFGQNAGLVFGETLSPDASLLAATDLFDRSLVRLFDPATRTQRFSLGGDGDIFANTFSPDSRLLVVIRSTTRLSSPDQQLELFDVTTGESVARHDVGAGYDAVFSPDGSLIAVPAEGGHVQVWGVLEPQG